MQEQDRYGVDPSQFTEAGRQDYARDCAEIKATRGMSKSPYANVYRLHCTDGYVEFRRTQSNPSADRLVAAPFRVSVAEVNGLQTGVNKESLLGWLRSGSVTLYDIH